MREFYASRIQQRSNEGHGILKGGRLFQQYLVDAYTAIEQNWLCWIRQNLPILRAKLYKVLKDAVVKGNTTPTSIGKRMVLPLTFTGWPRYMVKNYQDAMAICRWFRLPDLFVMFTGNPKWPELWKFLQQILGQGVEDIPDIECIVFKIKLDQLMKDLIQGRHFGRVIAVIYFNTLPIA